MDIPLEDDITNGSPNYRLMHCPQLGRYLVATKDIKRGEVILKDQPLATGPQKASTLLCPGCYQIPEANCQLCGWPMCSISCTEVKNHEPECSFLRSRHDWKPNVDRDWDKLSDSLMVVRCLLFKRTDQRKWKRMLEMEANWDKWARSPLFATANEIEQIIRNEFGLSPTEFPKSEILTVQAILDINAYEVRMCDSNIQAAYTLASLAEHNCSPNTHKAICSNSLELTFRAATDIPQGTHISTTYCDILWPTWHRQKYLQWSKFFVCKCERCLDPTELGSHLGAIVCMECSNTHKTVPAVPILGENESWENTSKNYNCSSCNAFFPAFECQLTFKKADYELSELDKDASIETIPAFDQWLNKWTLMEQILSSRVCEKNDADRDEINKTEHMEIPHRQTEKCYARILLHPQHSLVLDVCHTIFLLHPKEDCTIDQLKRKECFGTHLLNATKPLFTGISKLRGTILYELAMTKAAILVHQLEDQGMTDSLQHLAQEVLQLLHESQELLKYEPIDQPEGHLAQTGASQLEQLTLFFSELFNNEVTFKSSHLSQSV